MLKWLGGLDYLPSGSWEVARYLLPRVTGHRPECQREKEHLKVHPPLQETQKDKDRMISLLCGI